MNDKKFRFVVVGGGTAGVICSTYLKSYWGDLIDVTVVYDHSIPNIGVGESLTPVINRYLNFVGITKEEIIKHCNSTIKLGLQFKNWLGDGNSFYHPFNSFDVDTNNVNTYGFETAYQIVNDCYDNDTAYSNKLLDSKKVPQNLHDFAFHIDGNLFSGYILEKFKDKLEIIDDVIVDVVNSEIDNTIDHLVSKNNRKIHGDFFIDASGFKRILFNKTDNTWIDKKDWLPLNRFIGKQYFCEQTDIPVCTTSEATTDGWILQVPLQNRWGIGYLYSSEFTTDDTARLEFDKFLNIRYNTKIENTKTLSFESGYWHNQWVGNSICIGLSSGFAEPLEATNIHHTIFQVDNFINRFNFKLFDYDINQYNEVMRLFYDRVYLFLRFCYTTGRKDSNFWNYMTSNIPDEVIQLEEKIKWDILNIETMPHSIFNYNNFTKVAIGLKKINKSSYNKILENRIVTENASINTEVMKNIKDNMFENSLSHRDYINQVINL